MFHLMSIGKTLRLLIFKFPQSLHSIKSTRFVFVLLTFKFESLWKYLRNGKYNIAESITNPSEVFSLLSKMLTPTRPLLLPQ